ncbi:MAG: nicotinate (nicotinamide) nucleotide adenylyltransferase [Deltaproteobacteria bacterium]|jgi:nicotinate-nucleotide adenylyltransferase|nr:nicotinate (nicotinamide) nucleotide adenylyltransferase [Deltaproteobacteria bacterium]MBW2504329.1 nicotinate (nicotinamide) nucleotide adenylyltransferase [Deltaproteobacteria bacterium]MBW2519107.1 nicotinate (nicotinamide) nucleotide adenylyltransferase [Deltaproteobacteria bacterium]
MKTGILGGTFNPIHLAHLRIATDVKTACHLDRVLFIPAADPPHKRVSGNVGFPHRLAMVKAAIASYAGFEASDLESHRQGKSFSVDTLEILKREDPRGERFFIIGLDSYLDITSWKDFARLFELAHLVVMKRPGFVLTSPLSHLPVAIQKNFCYDPTSNRARHTSGNMLIFLQETFLDISSTQIRQRVATGAPIDHLVVPAVEEYIKTHNLYQEPFSGSL